MLKVIRNINQLPFGEVMQVYLQSNLQKAKLDHFGRADGLLQAEMDFYAYLRDGFFRTDGAYYCLWEDNRQVVSALRMEPYEDGLLLTGLETHPDCRGKGYACALMAAALEQAQCPVYSHIDRHNFASIAVHKKCGFEKVTNFAVFLDGSVSRNADTYARKFSNN